MLKEIKPITRLSRHTQEKPLKKIEDKENGSWKFEEEKD
jgi:hypothetical protein